MSARRPARVLATAALGAAALATAAAATAPAAVPPASGSPRLVIEAPRWALEGRAVALVVEPRGALAGRRLTLTVIVDGSAIERASSDGARSTLRIAARYLAPGSHEIGVKTGTESCFVAVRILPRRVLWLPTGLAALLAALALAARRRRRSG